MVTKRATRQGQILLSTRHFSYSVRALAAPEADAVEDTDDACTRTSALVPEVGVGVRG